MYYLVIRNLGTDKCIDKNVEDIYEDGQYYSCLADFSFVAGSYVKTVKIRCAEAAGTMLDATVYSD